MLPGLTSLAGRTRSDIGGNDANTLFLCHFDGADASTTFTDVAQNGLTITPVNNAQVDTAQYKFGSSSLLLDGAADYLTVADHADNDISGDFTLEAWVRFAALDPFMTLIDWGRYNLGAFLRARAAHVECIVRGTSELVSYTWATNTWYHVALVRSGSSCRMYVNGTAVGSGVATSAALTGLSDFRIGSSGHFGGEDMNGWMDEVRVSKVARWTSNFTPPTEPYS